jgi:hypothetical protein
MTRESPDIFIQWKGTNVCADFYCTCGEQMHFDGYFLYAAKCGACGLCWKLGTKVSLTPCGEDEPCLQTLEVDPCG